MFDSSLLVKQLHHEYSAMCNVLSWHKLVVRQLHHGSATWNVLWNWICAKLVSSVLVRGWSQHSSVGILRIINAVMCCNFLWEKAMKR